MMDRYVVILHIDQDTTPQLLGERLKKHGRRLIEFPARDPRHLWQNGAHPIYGGSSGEQVVGTTEYLLGPLPDEAVETLRLKQLAAAPRMREHGRFLEVPVSEDETASIAGELLKLREKLRQYEGGQFGK